MVAPVMSTGAFSVLIVALLNGFFFNNRIEIDTISEPRDEYDYIVVGSGPAGSTVAAKLATQSDSSILLVEAGNKPSEHGRIPGLTLMLLRSELDWDYLTVPQEYAKGAFNNRQGRWPQGKAIGGASSLNGMVYFWPAVGDMENWADATKDDTYRFKNMIKHFQRIENAGEIANRSRERGDRGPMHISSIDCCASPTCTAFLEAGRYHNLPINDLNGWNQYGFMPPQRTIRDGKRWSVVDGYLLPALKDRKNDLDVLHNALVEKVYVDYEKATGVKIRLESGKKVTVTARKEIIIAGGAIGSPKLLLLSGIGPRRHLETLGISVIKDLPVGNNLQDHLRFRIHYTSDSSAASNRTRSFDIAGWSTYLREGTGPQGHTPHQAFARFPRPSGKPGDILIGLQGPGVTEPALISHLNNLKPGAQNELTPNPADLSTPVIALQVTQLHPRSSGTVRLQTTDPDDPPLINPNYLKEDDDVDYILEGAKLATQLASSPPMKLLGLNLHVPIIPDCRPLHVPHEKWTPSVESEEYVRCWIRYAVQTNSHPIGTCRMGQPSDPTSVVDTKFRVLGIPNLRVVDSSIFPVNVACNTQGTVYGISDLAADIILKDNAETKTLITKTKPNFWSDTFNYLKDVKRNWRFPEFLNRHFSF